MKYLLVSLALIPLLLMGAPAQAQTETWCKTWTDGNIPFVFAVGYQGTTSYGLDTTNVFDWEGNTFYVYQYLLPTAVSRYVTTLEAKFDNAIGISGMWGGVGDKSILPFTDDSYIYNTVSIDGSTVTITVNHLIYDLAFILTTINNDPGYLHTITLRGEGTIPSWMGEDNCSDPEEPTLELVRPLTEADEQDTLQAESRVLYDLVSLETLSESNEGELYDAATVLAENTLYSVSAWSDSPGAAVHAAADGYVESIIPLDWQDCGYGQVGIIGPNPIQFYSFLSTEPQPCVVALYDMNPIFLDPETATYTEVALAAMYLDPTNVSVVKIRMGDDSVISYLVQNAEQYVTVGDSIQEGCVLGLTVALTNQPIQALNFLRGLAGFIWSGSIFGWGTVGVGLAELVANPSASSWGYTVLQLTDVEGDAQPLAESLTVIPTNEDRCKDSGEYAGCLTDDSTFSSNASWDTVGNVEFTNPGVILDPGESVSQLLNLDPVEGYTLTVQAQSPGLEGELRGWIGSITTRETVYSEVSDIQIEASPVGAGDYGDLWTVGVQNTGSTVLIINSVCVTSGAAPDNPNSCYFTNHSFIAGLSGWTVSEGVTSEDQSLLVPDDGVISQTVHLYPKPDGAASYQLTIYADWWYSGSIDPVGPEASMQYEYPAGSGYVSLEPEIVSGGLAYGMGTIVYRDTISVSTETDAVMNIKVLTTSGTSMTVEGLRINEACLSGKFQQSTGGTVPTLTADCSYVARPRTNDPAAWTQWHWLNLNKFFKCDLMVLLNKMWQTIRNIFNLIGWSMRYIMSSMTATAQWSGSQLFPWLEGHFRNIAIGQVTNITQEGGGTIWDVLLALISGVLSPLTDGVLQIVNLLVAIVGGAAGILFSVISAVITIVLAIAGQVLGFAQLGQSLLGTIITAYNTSTPQTIPGLPNCSGDPRSNAFCISIWVLDNTIFSGTGAAIIPLIVGILSIHLILWIVGELKKTIVEIGQAA